MLIISKVISKSSKNCLCLRYISLFFFISTKDIWFKVDLLNNSFSGIKTITFGSLFNVGTNSRDDFVLCLMRLPRKYNSAVTSDFLVSTFIISFLKSSKRNSRLLFEIKLYSLGSKGLNMDLSQYLGHDLWEFFRDSSGWVSHRFDQPSNQNRLTADRSDEVEALWKSRQKNVGGS